MATRQISLIFYSVIIFSTCSPTGGIEMDVNDVFKFFPECKNDGLNLRWAHAVNSWSYLNETLANETSHRVEMIEGDVIIRQTAHKCPEDTPIPVMAHPPATDSDLTFHDWLISINQFRAASSQSDQIRVGAKADFKSLEAAQAALKFVQDYNQSLSVPLWLNADIVRGPGGSALPVNGQQFLRACTDSAPGMTISIGWTTPPNIDRFRCRWGYGWREILAMYHQIAPFIRETAASGQLPRMTFAVRAALLKVSYFRLSFLLDACTAAAGGDQYADRFSITLWTSASADQLTIDDYAIITRLRMTLGRSRVFIDLPDSDTACLRELDPSGPSIDTSKTFDRSQWESINLDNTMIISERTGLAFLGETSTQLKSIRQPTKSILNLQLIFVPRSDIADHRSSILISVSMTDRVVWTLEISGTRCTIDSTRPNHDCFQLQPLQPYSVSITAEGHHVKVEWRTEEEETHFQIATGLTEACNAPALNCTRSHSSTSHGSNSRTLHQALADFKFVIEKMGPGDFVIEKLTLTH